MAKQFQLVLTTLLLTFACSNVLAEVIAEVASANVTFAGGPKSGTIELGKNFALHCSVAIQYPNRESWGWKYTTTFYHNDIVLGEFKKMDKGFIYWVTENIIPGMNVFTNSEIAETFDTTYSVVVQPLTSAALGRYSCSVTLENAFTKARYFSNILGLEWNTFQG